MLTIGFSIIGASVIAIIVREWRVRREEAALAEVAKRILPPGLYAVKHDLDEADVVVATYDAVNGRQIEVTHIVADKDTVEILTHYERPFRVVVHAGEATHRDLIIPLEAP